MSDGHSTEQMEENLFLQNARTDKVTDHGENFAFCGMQGFRKSNEDFHKHLIPFNNQSWKHWSFFAILDGHNGDRLLFFSFPFISFGFFQGLTRLKMLQIFLVNIYLKHLMKKQFIQQKSSSNNLNMQSKKLFFD